MVHNLHNASLLSNNIKIFHVLNILNSYNLLYSQLNIFQKQKFILLIINVLN
jgi:hypothetical protein